MAMEDLKRALSIRQPHSEMILVGKKKEEYRGWLTHIRGRVYLYAGKKRDLDVPGITNEASALLPRSVIVGSVEITGCHWDKKRNCFAWELSDSVRYPRPLVPQGVPQPAFWHPKF